MGRDGLGHDFDVHALERLGSVDEELHLRFLLFAAQRGAFDFLVEEFLRGFHIRECWPGEQTERDRKCGTRFHDRSFHYVLPRHLVVSYGGPGLPGVPRDCA